MANILKYFEDKYNTERLRLMNAIFDLNKKVTDGVVTARDLTEPFDTLDAPFEDRVRMQLKCYERELYSLEEHNNTYQRRCWAQEYFENEVMW